MSEDVDWINLDEERDERRAIVSTVMRRCGGTVPLILNGVGDVSLFHSDNFSVYIL
jgi:dihydrodipicolinate synthase/N-acetylneuraminate lyase